MELGKNELIRVVKMDVTNQQDVLQCYEFVKEDLKKNGWKEKCFYFAILLVVLTLLKI